jgi:hypothetical protein
VAAQSLADIAEALDPQSGGVPSDLVGRLAVSFGSEWTNSLVGRLHLIATRLAARDVTVTFGGHFSSGKSTLINAIIGRPLLPTSDYPETGVPCVITSGTGDRAVAVTRDGAVDLGFDADSIARMVSLIGDDGEYRRRVEDVLRLEVTLANGALPGGLALVDSPGINDMAGMTARAAALTRNTDILIWVLNSRQPVSETEQAFFLEQLDGGSRRGLVPVVNAFLPADTAEYWTWFLAERVLPIRSRVDAALDLEDEAHAGRPAVLFVSARGAGSDPAGFGAPAVRQLITGFTLGSPQVRAARLARAEADLRALVTELDERLDHERKQVDQARSALSGRQRDAARRRQQFERALARDVAAAFARHRDASRHCVMEVAAAIGGSQPLHRDGTYSELLAGRLRELTGRLAGEVLAETARSASRFGQTSPSRRTAQRVRKLLASAEVEILVPNTPAGNAGPTGLGAAIGGVLGTAIVPGGGTLIGAALGSSLGRAAGFRRAAASRARDRAAAQANALTAGEAAITTLMSRQAAVERTLHADCRPSQSLPAAPDGTRLAQLVSLRDRLVGQQLRRLSREAKTAQGEVGR